MQKADSSRGLVMLLSADYVRVNKFGGMMIWEISTDDEQGSLIHALFTRLR
jgi:GH18 family chitinase